MERAWESALPPDLAEAVRRVLGPGEQVVWCGRPGRALYEQSFRLAVWVPLIVMAAVIAMVGVAIPCSGPRSGLSPFGLVLMIPVLVVGALACLPAIRALAANQRRSGRATVYAITNRRALSLQAGSDRGTKSWNAEYLGRRTRTKERDGSGTIRVAESSASPQPPWRAKETLEFVGVENVDEVDALLGAIHAAAVPENAAPAAPAPKGAWYDLFEAAGMAMCAVISLQQSRPVQSMSDWAFSVGFVVGAFVFAIRFAWSFLKKLRWNRSGGCQPAFHWDRL